MHCDPGQLCERCFPEELARLRPVAEARCLVLADVLARAVVPEPSWVELLDEHHDLIRRQTSDLARDPRLVAELARSGSQAARRRLASPR